MAVTVKFIADVVNWLSGLSKSEDAIGDNEAALEDLMEQAIKLGTEAGYTTDKIASDFSEAFGVPLDQAKRAVDEVTSSTEDLGTASDDAGKQMGDGISDGASRAGDSMSELGNIAKDVLEGDFSGAAQSAAGALSLLGPVGVAAGAAAALGIGVITSTIQQQQEEADKLKERLSDAYSAAAEAGQAYIDTASVIANTHDLMFNTDRAEEWQKVQDTQKETGLEMSTLLKANAGDLEALAIVTGRVAEENRKAADAGEEANVFLDAGGTKIQKLTDYWTKLGTESKSQSQKSADSIRYTNDLLREQIDAAQGATKEVDELGNELYTLPNGDQILIDVETGQATKDLHNFKGDVDNKTQPVTQKIKVVVDKSAWENWQPRNKVGAVAAYPSLSGRILTRKQQPM